MRRVRGTGQIRMERMSAQIQAGSLYYTTARLLDADPGVAKCSISILLVFFSRQLLRLILCYLSAILTCPLSCS
jgi:hypothetical protein